MTPEQNHQGGAEIIATTNPAFEEFNRKTQEFWEEQKALMDQRMADRDILEIAIATVAFEAMRCVPVQSQMSFEKALQDAAEAKQRILRQQARSGGKAAKTDPLQESIVAIVRQNPGISARALLSDLKYRQGDEIIEQIDENSYSLQTCQRDFPTAARPDLKKDFDIYVGATFWPEASANARATKSQ